MTQTMNKHLVRMRLIGRILCPLHAGTGETLDPFSLVLHKGRLHRVDLEDILTNLEPAKARVAADLISNNNLVALRQRLQEWYDPTRHPARWSVGMSPAFAGQYQQAMAHDLNRLEIAAHRRHPVTGQPYIPGSTIKGALRTALVAQRAAAAHGSKHHELMQIAADKRRQGDFEPTLFGRKPGEMHRAPSAPCASATPSLPPAHPTQTAPRVPTP